jgi:hypothetical protein
MRRYEKQVGVLTARAEELQTQMTRLQLAANEAVSRKRCWNNNWRNSLTVIKQWRRNGRKPKNCAPSWRRRIRKPQC